MGVHRKLKTNLSACRSEGIVSILLVIETLGGLAEDPIHTSYEPSGKAIGPGNVPVLLTRPWLQAKHLFARFAIALFAGNTSMWLHHQPILPPALDGLWCCCEGLV